jgi:hypothetical protein
MDYLIWQLKCKFFTNQIAHLAHKLYPKNTKFILESDKDATTQPFGYFLLDLEQIFFIWYTPKVRIV